MVLQQEAEGEARLRRMVITDQDMISCHGKLPANNTYIHCSFLTKDRNKE